MHTSSNNLGPLNPIRLYISTTKRKTRFNSWTINHHQEFVAACLVLCDVHFNSSAGDRYLIFVVKCVPCYVRVIVFAPFNLLVNQSGPWQQRGRGSSLAAGIRYSLYFIFELRPVYDACHLFYVYSSRWPWSGFFVCFFSGKSATVQSTGSYVRYS